MSERMTSKVAMEDPPLCSLNREFPQFPPPDDFPVCTSKRGVILARFEDNSWPMQEWLGKVYTFRFGVESTSKISPWLLEQESYFFKLILVFIMWVDPGGLKPSTLQSRYGKLRTMFKFCAENGISVTELYKFPHLVSGFILLVGKFASQYVSLMRAIYNNQGLLGFKLLNPRQIADLVTAGKARVSRQTPYIPSRISQIHLLRSLELMEDYNRHADSFERLYEYIWSAYVDNNGSAITWHQKLVGPFNKSAKVAGCHYFGLFQKTAEEFGVKDVLIKWMSRRPGGCAKLDLTSFSSFLSCVVIAGSTCIASLSAMRKEEINNLRVDCFEMVETDLGKVCYLRGETTKTIHDDDARWVTCEDTLKAISAMASIAKLRMVAAVELGVDHSPDEVANPYLISRVYEPWSHDWGKDRSIQTSLRKAISASSLYKDCPILFLPGDTVITQQDFDEALKANPDLNIERFAVGDRWSFAFHQFRRTLMVNGSLSNLVSPQSMQYQLKHLYLSMQMYYGQNYSGLAFNSKAKEEFIETSYEMMASRVMELKSPKFVSTISPLHKERAISYYDGKTIKQLTKMAGQGTMSVKETVMGICLNTEPCEFGSADFVLGCNECTSGLACKDNLPLIKKVDDRLKSQLDAAKEDGPRKDALRVQYEFTQKLINVVLV